MAGHYDCNATTFFDATATLEMPSLWAPFLELLPAGARILDAGCGSGRDSLHFAKRGHAVEAIDASQEMARVARAHSGVPVRVQRLQDIDAVSRFDGVWCCAAALHVPFTELPAVVHRLHRALQVGGVCYISFKRGLGERTDGDRRFTDMTEATASELLVSVPGVSVLRVWCTRDIRPGREDEQWVNTLSRRVGETEP